MSVNNDIDAQLPSAKDFLPGSLKADYVGKMIIVEGSDGSGRSTHIRLLQDWLEWRGYAVSNAGLKRSKLLGKDLGSLARSNELQPRTRLLLYATDLYDQIEQTVIPSLRAGFIVLMDRSALTLAARACVRGIEEDYLNNLFQYLPQPDASFLLEVPPETAFNRLFAQEQKLMHHEFGGDTALAGTVFDRFMVYQNQLQSELIKRAASLSCERINANRSVQEVNLELRTKVAELLGIDDTRYRPSEKLMGVWNEI